MRHDLATPLRRTTHGHAVAMAAGMHRPKTLQLYANCWPHLMGVFKLIIAAVSMVIPGQPIQVGTISTACWLWRLHVPSVHPSLDVQHELDRVTRHIIHDRRKWALIYRARMCRHPLI